METGVWVGVGGGGTFPGPAPYNMKNGPRNKNGQIKVVAAIEHGV